MVDSSNLTRDFVWIAGVIFSLQIWVVNGQAQVAEDSAGQFAMDLER